MKQNKQTKCDIHHSKAVQLAPETILSVPKPQPGSTLIVIL